MGFQAFNSEGIGIRNFRCRFAPSTGSLKTLVSAVFVIVFQKYEIRGIIAQDVLFVNIAHKEIQPQYNSVVCKWILRFRRGIYIMKVIPGRRSECE